MEQNLYSIIYDETFEMPKSYTEVDLDSSILDIYTGAYEWLPGISLDVIKKEDNKLYIQWPGGPKEKICAYSTNEFFHKTKNAQYSF